MTKKVFSTEAMKKDYADTLFLQIMYADEDKRESLIRSKLEAMFEFAYGCEGWTRAAEGKTNDEMIYGVPDSWCVEVEYEEDNK